MSDQNLDHAALRRNIEKSLYRQKWLYRILFFSMHTLFFVVSMLAVWGTLASNAQLRALLLNADSRASVIVIVPTILWAAVLLFHSASLFFESAAGEKVIRQRLLIREVGEDILRQGDMDEGILEKPKRRPTVLDAERLLSSDDGELMPADEDELIEHSEYNARTYRANDS